VNWKLYPLMVVEVLVVYILSCLKFNWFFSLNLYLTKNTEYFRYKKVIVFV